MSFSKTMARKTKKKISAKYGLLSKDLGAIRFKENPELC